MRTTLITGTTKGIGNSSCKHFINKNHRVISVSRSEIDFSHENLFHYKIDITHSMSKTIIDKIISNEKINNCIINAGVSNSAMFHKMTFEEWHNTLNTNLISIYNILNPVINNMRLNNKGNVLLVSSVLGKTGNIGASNYASSKSGIYGLTKSLALENASKNILVNSISPGYINEGMGKMFNDSYKASIIEKIPLKKFGEKNDIISITDYFLEHNKYITGTDIDINGGLY